MILWWRCVTNNRADVKPHLRLIALIGVLVPRRLRADWKQEWEAEFRYRELLLADWEKLNWRTKFDLLRRSLGAFWDALCWRVVAHADCLELAVRRDRHRPGDIYGGAAAC